MTFNINFDNDVWKNQRRAIQKLGTTSVFYKLLKALLGPLLVRGDDLQSMLDVAKELVVLFKERAFLHRQTASLL